jgi:Zinc binding domain
MSGCCDCSERGSPVQLRTVKALLTEVALRRVRLTHYRFCANPACETVYFDDAGGRFATQDVRVPVWQKQASGARLLCYCFGETEAGIRSELLEHRRTEVAERIRTHIAAQRCACDTRNPRGACCLSDVLAAMRRIEGATLSGKED